VYDSASQRVPADGIPHDIEATWPWAGVPADAETVAKASVHAIGRQRLRPV